MKKLFLFVAAMVFAFAANAAAVVLPDTLDVNNVSFRSEGMPDFVLTEGDYAGTYFDMGAHDSSNDTLLYAEWDVTIEPLNYYVTVDVYNTNSWTVQFFLLNQAGETLKELSYHGHSGDKGQFAAGSLDLRDLAAGDYKLRARSHYAWSALKLKDVIFTADYSGVTVALPGTLLPAYAELSTNASITDGAIAFKPSTAPDEYANWNVSFAQAGTYTVSIDMTASNGHNYGVELIGEDEETSYGAVNEGGQKGDTGVKELGTITVPAAGNYIVHLTNATVWSEAVLNSITFAAPAPAHTYTVAGSSTDLFGTEWAPANEANDMALVEGLYTWEKEEVTLAAGTVEFKVVEDHAWTNCWPSENYKLNIAEAGIYTITITFNADTKDVAAVATKAGDVPPTPVEHTYTVAGSSTDLFGTAWAPANEANDMVLVEGIYTWEKTELTLAAGTIEFKVCEDHAWTTAYPAQNYKLNIPEAGIYTVTITFNAETKEVAAVATKTGSAVVIPTVAMHGNFLGGWADTENFAIAEGNATASLTLNIEAGDYEFGMRIGGSGNWTANGVSFTRENPSAVIVAGSGNLKLAADKAGEYTFTWTYETNTLAITFPTGTGIQQTNAEMKAVKMIENGQIVIIKNGIRYNVLGAVISK